MKRFKHILYHADDEVLDKGSLTRAVALARTNQAALTVMDVIDASELAADVEQRFGLDLSALLVERRREQLETLIEPFRDSGLRIDARVVSGTPFIELIRAVQREAHDLLMKAPHPTEGLTQRLFGSFDLHLLRKCPCPVWIDRPESKHPYANILAAIGSIDAEHLALNRLIMDLASSLARREAAQLHVVHAWRMPGEKMLRSGRARLTAAQLEQLLKDMEQNQQYRLNELLAAYGLSSGSPRVKLVKEKTAKAITAYSTRIDADLIVMGTLGRTGIPGLIIGNAAEDVLQTTQTSILAVKPEGFVSPVSP